VRTRCDPWAGCPPPGLRRLTKSRPELRTAALAGDTHQLGGEHRRHVSTMVGDRQPDAQGVFPGSLCLTWPGASGALLGISPRKAVENGYVRSAG
jgi:hypothetical protein